MRNWIARLALVALFLSAPAMLKAQNAASLTGVVADASGAVVPGVTVILSNKLTGAKFTQTTGKDGSYIFSNVPAADGYAAIFSHDGFASLTVDHLFLGVGKTRTLDEKLGVASSTETVAVSAANQEVTLNTTDASIGNNIDVDMLNELPIYDRTGGIGTLFNLQAGVDFSSGSVTGARIDQTEVTVDGMDVNDIAAGTTFAIVANAPVDSVEQFGGTVAGLVPAVGTGSGAQFQLVTKSGTNKFHGNINEYNRNTDYVANQWFNNLHGIPRTPLIQNQFGGNIGGPIKKDKLFFFFNFGQSRIVSSATSEITVPLPNLTNANPTLNYINNGTGCNYLSRLNTTPTCISSLSASQVASLDPAGIGFSPSVLTFLAGRFPAANDLTAGDGVNTGGYRFTVPTPDNDTTYVGKVDYNFTQKQHIFARLTLTRQNATESLPVLPTDPATHPFIDRSYGYVVSHIWTIGKNKVNQFYYGDTISKYSFPNAYNPTGANQYSLTGVSSPYSGTDGQKRRVPIPEFRDDFNWQLGTHDVTFGGTFKFVKTNSNLVNDFNFVGIGATGNALGNGLDNNDGEPSVRPADIYTDPNHTAAVNDYDSIFASTLGVIGDIFTNYNYTSTGAAVPAGTGGPRNYRYFQTELYVGDTWKVLPKFSLTYGLRYQLYTVPYETHGEESLEFTSTTTPEKSTIESYIADRLAQSAAGNTSFNGLPIYSVELGGKANKGPNLYAPSYKDFAPRIGFAYNPVPHTVINGSVGIVYDRTVINAINFLQDQISYLFSNQQVAQFGSPANATQSSAVASLQNNPRVGSSTCSLSGGTAALTSCLSYSSSLNPPPAPLTVPYTPYVDDASGDNTGIPGQPYGLAAGETNFVISPNLKDPYSIAFNFGIQQELPQHMLLKMSYAGRLGRRLLADADAGQVIDVPDYTGGSTQTMAQAFAALTTESRAGQALTPQPWFEDVLAPYGAQIGFGNNTNLVAAMVGQLAARGDMSDMLYQMAYYSVFQGFTGFLPTNIGIPSQFGSNAYLTNMGNSNYNGLLITLVKNESHGLRFDFNYTFSRSIDNTSLSANANSLFSNSGFICDVTRPRACRGKSDFDVTHIITSDFIYHLPIGTGKLLFGKSNFLVNEAIGGWSISAIPTYRSGQAVTPYAQAYLASFDNLDPAIYIGSNKGILKSHKNYDPSTGYVYNFAGGANGAVKALAQFRGPIGLEYGSRNLLRGPNYINIDAGLEKVFPIIPAQNLHLIFRADAFNVLNHPTFGNPGVSIVGNQGAFGQIGGTSNSARVMQLSLRLEF
jgi:hypothetical protein